MEMLLVLGIIALLLGMGTFMMIGVVNDAEVGRVRGDIESLRASLIRYKTNSGMYPTAGQGLNALVTRPTDGPEPRNYKPLIREQALKDPWGNPYRYRIPGKENPDFDVFSVGVDGQENTDDDIGNF